MDKIYAATITSQIIIYFYIVQSYIFETLKFARLSFLKWNLCHTENIILHTLVTSVISYLYMVILFLFISAEPHNTEIPMCPTIYKYIYLPSLDLFKYVDDMFILWSIICMCRFCWIMRIQFNCVCSSQFKKRRTVRNFLSQMSQ